MRIIFIIAFMFFSQTLTASEPLWTDIDARYQYRTPHTKIQQMHVARKMHLNYEAIKQTLTSTTRGIDAVVALPTPDGAFINFTLEATSVMSATLAERYPDIKTWKITSTANPEVTGRIDIGPRGFHGLFNTIDGDRVFIDPEHQEGTPQTEIYTVLSRRENHGSTDSGFTCELHDEHSHNQISSRILENPATNLRTYRLALAVTGEYTQLFGGTKAYALAGVTSTVNRLNQVFERDLNIHLELIAENDKLLFTSPSSDPYNNQDATSMLKENVVSTNAIIGADNYDIGHVFGTGPTGGLAFLNSVCGSNKAGGVTGSNSPEGEAFNIDYVAHELGHQLGAAHTFNGYLQNCSANNRVQDSAVEPGSGSSIMGYAGICGGDDLQDNSNAYFHSHSIAQIRAFTQTAQGAKCGIVTASLNNNPVVNAGNDYNIPAQTPFELKGTSHDVDGDPLLHSWEQTDIGTTSDLYSDLMDNPLFRLRNPTTDKSRVFPRLKELCDNKKPLGELLPTTDRKLNFSLLVRDNKGGIATDSVELSVINTGAPFAITTESIPSSLAARESFELKWDTANTDKAPINCQRVDIGLIHSMGRYIPLLHNSPNDGAEVVNLPVDIPSLVNTNIKVACRNNIFFAVSSTQYDVEGGQPILEASYPATGVTANMELETLAVAAPAGGSLDLFTSLLLLLLLCIRFNSVIFTDIDTSFTREYF